MISDDIPSPNENFEYDNPYSNALLQFGVLQAACHSMICDVINEVKLFPSVYHMMSQIFDTIQADIAFQKQVHQNCWHFNI